MVKNKKNLIRRIKYVCILLLAPPPITYLEIFAINNLSSNQTNISKDSLTIQKADGADGYTEYGQAWNKQREIIEERVIKSSSLGGQLSMRDGGYRNKIDGKVDSLYLINVPLNGMFSPEITSTLERNEDYPLFKEQFDQADILLAQTKERFARQISQYSPCKKAEKE